MKVSLPNVAHTDLKDHSITAQIQITWFPSIHCNPQKFI